MNEILALKVTKLIVFLLLFSAAAEISAQNSDKPGARLGHSMIYDEHQGKVFLLDGFWSEIKQTVPSAGIWVFADEHWKNIPAIGPAARDVGSAVYDSRRKKIVSYGGMGKDGKPFGDTWEWNGKIWLQMADTNVGSRFHHAMAYDAGRGKTVMYGGKAAGRWDTETWEWDGKVWEKIVVQGPGERAAFRMVFDGKRRQVVLFGGIGASPGEGQPQPFYNDTWIWNGKKWTEIKMTGLSPGYRYVSAMVYNAANGKTVLYGGYSCERVGEGCKVLSDTWEWNGKQWTNISEEKRADNPLSKEFLRREK